MIVYPTEAVWGIGCDPENEGAVMKLLAAKNRPVEKGLILVAQNLSQCHDYFDFDKVPLTLSDDVYIVPSNGELAVYSSL